MKLKSLLSLSTTPLLFHSTDAIPIETESRTQPLGKRHNVPVTGLGGLTFRIQQVPNSAFVGGSARGPLALARAYSKWGQPIPDDLSDLVQEILERLGLVPGISVKRPTPTRPAPTPSPTTTQSTTPALPINTTGPVDPGEVLAVPATFDSQYLCQVQIGTPPQNLTLNFDTGSSDLWVFSSETPRELVGDHGIYDIGKSSTAKRLEGATWSIEYGDGSSSSGNVFLDTVSIGGIKVENQAVESATDVSAAFTGNSNQDGLVGLAFGNINTVVPDRQKTFFENAISKLAMPLFTANLRKNETGSYNFGVIDSSEFTGDITFTDVNSTSGHWLFNIESIAIGNQPVSSRGPQSAIADTGTTLMLLQPDVVDAYYSQIPSAAFDQTQGGYFFDCRDDIPDFTAMINGFSAVVPGEFIRFAPLDTEDIETASVCFGGIQAVSPGFPVSIFGDVFLKAFFVVFHQQMNQLGFANKPL